MKITKLQFEKFKKLCDASGERLFGTDEFIKEKLELALKLQGYWSGEKLRYYLDGDNWRTEVR